MVVLRMAKEAVVDFVCCAGEKPSRDAMGN